MAWAGRPFGGARVTRVEGEGGKLWALVYRDHQGGSRRLLVKADSLAEAERRWRQVQRREDIARLALVRDIRRAGLRS
jgi:hypothetical protein